MTEYDPPTKWDLIVLFLLIVAFIIIGWLGTHKL